MKGTFRFIYSSLNGKGSRTQVVGSEDEFRRNTSKVFRAETN